MALVAACCVAPGAWAYNELALTMSGAPERFIEGDRATLVAKITNVDPLMRTGSLLQLNARPLGPDPDVLPTISGSNCDSVVKPAVTCFISGDLPFGASREHTLTVTSRVLGEIILEMGASAQVGDDFPLVLLAAPQLQWRTTVEPKADLKLDFTASPETVPSGGDVSVRAAVTNTRAFGVAYGAAVRFSLPPELQIVSRPDGCTGTPLNLTCPVGDVGSLLTTQRLLTVRSTQEGSFTILGSVAWARPDPTPVDTQGQVSFTVLPPPEPPEPPGPPPKAPEPPKPRAVSAGKLAVGLPAAGRCIRARTLHVVLRSRGSWDPIRATIRVTGRRRALVLKGAQAQRPFTLRLPRSGRVTVRLSVTLDNGRRYTATRSFRRC